TRYTPAGALDTTFGNGGTVAIDFQNEYDFANGLSVDAAGRVVVVGSTYVNDSYDIAAVRLDVNGQLDTTFSEDWKLAIDLGATNALAVSVAHDSTGRVIIAGNQDGNMLLIRLTKAGALDLTFDADGKQAVDFGSLNDQAAGATVDDSDRIVVVGSTGTDV